MQIVDPFPMETPVVPPKNECSAASSGGDEDIPTMAILDKLSSTTDPAVYDKLYAQLDSVH